MHDRENECLQQQVILFICNTQIRIFFSSPASRGNGRSHLSAVTCHPLRLLCKIFLCHEKSAFRSLSVWLLRREGYIYTKKWRLLWVLTGSFFFTFPHRACSCNRGSRSSFSNASSISFQRTITHSWPFRITSFDSVFVARPLSGKCKLGCYWKCPSCKLLGN